MICENCGHYWVAVYNSSLTLVARSADQTTTAWAVNVIKDFTFITPFVTSGDARYYVGIMVDQTGAPKMKGATLSHVALATGTGNGLYDAGLTDTPPAMATLAVESVDVLWAELLE